MERRLTPSPIPRLRILATGGTIDKIYFDALSDFQVGDSEVAELLRQARVDFSFEIEQVLRKDSIQGD